MLLDTNHMTEEIFCDQMLLFAKTVKPMTNSVYTNIACAK